MIYQFTTCFPLAGSKTYLDDPSQAMAILKRSVRLTNEFREKNKLRLVSDNDIEIGSRMLRIDSECPMNIFGVPQEISVKNLIDIGISAS